MKDITDEMKDYNEETNFMERLLERKLRYFEIENLRDLEDNYGNLSNTSRLPFLYKCSLIFKDLFFLGISEEDIEDDSQLERDGYFDLVRYEIFMRNFNYGFIDNVSLRNFRYINKRSYRAFEFDIKDYLDEEPVRGLFVYYKISCPEVYEGRQEQMECVLSSQPITTFNLHFTALTQRPMFTKRGIWVPEPRKLLVHYIERNDGGDDTYNNLPYDIPAVSPVLQSA